MLALRVALVLALTTTGASALAGEPPPKDPVPDYDGLGNHAAQSDSNEVALAIARAPLLPLYAVSEFGLRAPVGAVVRSAEKHHWAGALYDFFTSADGKIGVLPSAFFDFGVRPSVGFFFFWNDAFAKGNDLRFHFGTWGPTWLHVALLDRYRLDADKTLDLRAAFSRRQDLYFNGLGPESTVSHESRYEANRLDVGPSLVVGGNRFSSLTVAAGVRRIDYGSGACCGDPSIDVRVVRGDYPEPPHFDHPYTAMYERLDLVLDSRRPVPHPGTGTRIELYGEPAFHPRPTNPESWLRYGGSIGQTVDLNGHQRNLSLTVAADFADPLVGSDVPFNEQPTLGGGQAPAGSFVETKMRGFRYGRLVGRSAFVTTLQYTWPVWFLLEGVVQLSAGNVFGPALRGMDADLLRMSGVIGVRTNQQRDTHFEILLGAGTETIRDGMALESFRLAIGTTHGF